MQRLTVKQLRDSLAGYDDDAIVLVESGVRLLGGEGDIERDDLSLHAAFGVYNGMDTPAQRRWPVLVINRNTHVEVADRDGVLSIYETIDDDMARLTIPL